MVLPEPGLRGARVCEHLGGSGSRPACAYRRKSTRHWSLSTFRLLQSCFLASGLNASTTIRLSAFMNAIRANIVGLVEYQKAVPGLDLDKYQTQKVRHYRNRCREIGTAPDQSLIDAILDPSIDFVVGVQAG